jgi:hypothetical protein
LPNRGNCLLSTDTAVAPFQAATTTDNLPCTFQHVLPVLQEEVLTHVGQVALNTASLFNLRTGDGNPPWTTTAHADPSHADQSHADLSRADLFFSQFSGSSATDARSLPISITGTPVEQSTAALNASTSYTVCMTPFNPISMEKTSSPCDSLRTTTLNCSAEPYLPSSRLHNTILRVPTLGLCWRSETQYGAYPCMLNTCGPPLSRTATPIEYQHYSQTEIWFEY